MRNHNPPCYKKKEVFKQLRFTSCFASNSSSTYDDETGNHPETFTDDDDSSRTNAQQRTSLPSTPEPHHPAMIHSPRSPTYNSPTYDYDTWEPPRNIHQRQGLLPNQKHTMNDTAAINSRGTATSFTSSTCEGNEGRKLKARSSTPLGWWPGDCSGSLKLTLLPLSSIAARS